MSVEELRKAIRDIPDFPTKGVVFKDITPVLGSPRLFRRLVQEMAAEIAPLKLSKLAGIESRGFILASALAYELQCGLVLVRKKRKLPWKTLQESYDLEYGSDVIEIHEDSFQKNESVVVVDDVLATGGTALGALKLCERAGARVLGLSVLIELEFLRGRARLDPLSVKSLIRYS